MLLEVAQPGAVRLDPTPGPFGIGLVSSPSGLTEYECWGPPWGPPGCALRNSYLPNSSLPLLGAPLPSCLTQRRLWRAVRLSDSPGAVICFCAQNPVFSKLLGKRAYPVTCRIRGMLCTAKQSREECF